MSSRRALFALATSARLERAVRALPGGEGRAYAAARRYVAGTERADALRVAVELSGHGIASSLDLFGEDVGDPARATRVASDYVELASATTDIAADANLAVDLSHLALDADPAGCLVRVLRIAEALPEGRELQVGAEQAGRTDAILGCVLAAHEHGARVSATLQANLRRSADDAMRLAAAGVPVRLVKGAYVEQRTVALPYGEPTDRAFAQLAHQLHAEGASIALATHDRALLAALLPALPGAGVEHLLGVRPESARELAASAIPIRVYVPYGKEWFRYWMRRVAESRGAG